MFHNDKYIVYINYSNIVYTNMKVYSGNMVYTYIVNIYIQYYYI